MSASIGQITPRQRVHQRQHGMLPNTHDIQTRGEAQPCCPVESDHRMSRAIYLQILAACWLATVCFPASEAAEATSKPASRPNIIFFLADDQRFDTLGCAGHPIVKTPHIDRLAANGVRFRNQFVTTSVCWVSRATLLTGQWARTHALPRSIPTVRAESLATIYPVELHKAGYRTGYIGKWHLIAPAGFQPEQQFDAFESIKRGPYIKTLADGSQRDETDNICDSGIEFLRSQPRDAPFCLSLWFNAAHAEDNDHRPGIGHYPWPASTDGMYENVAIPPPRLNSTAIYDAHPEFLKKSINRQR